MRQRVYRIERDREGRGAPVHRAHGRISQASGGHGRVQQDEFLSHRGKRQVSRRSAEVRPRIVDRIRRHATRSHHSHGRMSRDRRRGAAHDPTADGAKSKPRCRLDRSSKHERRRRLRRRAESFPRRRLRGAVRDGQLDRARSTAGDDVFRVQSRSRKRKPVHIDNARGTDDVL